MTLHRSLLALAVCALAVTLASSDTPVTSEKYAPGTYRLQAGRITVYVDGYPASLHADDPYIPVRVALRTERTGKPIRIDTESFTLIDQYGHAYPMAPYKTFTEAYKKRVFDESLFRGRPMPLDSKFSVGHQVESRFFPAPGRTRITRVELGPFTWLADVVYFKRPASLGGVLTLRVTARGLPEPVETRFRILENEQKEDKTLR